MIHTKRVIFVVIMPLVVMLVINSYSPSILVQGVPDWSVEIDCEIEDEFLELVKCCWVERFPEGYGARVCQTCSEATTPPTCGPMEKTLEQPPTPPPSGPAAPPQGGVEQPPTTTPPPLFGENTNVPPTAGIEQPPTTTTPQIPPRLPGGGADVPTEGGSAEQPTAPQDDNQGGLPPIKNQENVPPGGGVAEQPQDDGQEESSEGAETAGPLT